MCDELSGIGSAFSVGWRGSLPFLVEDIWDLHFLLGMGEDDGEGEGESELDGVGGGTVSAAVDESQDLLDSYRRRE